MGHRLTSSDSASKSTASNSSSGNEYRTEIEHVQWRGVAQHQEPADKGLEHRVALPLGVSDAVELVALGVYAGHGAPEAAPSPRQQACMHELDGVQVGENADEDVVVEAVDPAGRAGNARHEDGLTGAFRLTGGAQAWINGESLSQEGSRYRRGFLKNKKSWSEANLRSA
jgi:hypothetical protein